MAVDIERTHDAEPKARIFISYSRKDMTFADRLDDALKTRGFEPLIDREEIYAFEDWWKRLQTLITRADTIVFVLSPDSVASREALKEVEFAASLNKRFAPIVCRRVDDRATPEPLQRLNFIFFDDPSRFEDSADQLAEALQTDIGWIRRHTEFGEAAGRWSATGRPGGLLLRSPVLEEAERWIAARPRGAPAPTEETQAFVAASRRGTTRRRNILTGSLAAGLVVALALAGFAEQQRLRAEATLAAATKTANSLVFDLAQQFRNTTGIPAAVVKDILDRARALQGQLIQSGQVTPDLKRSEGAALLETTDSLLAIGDTAGALAAAQQSWQIFTDLLAANPNRTDSQRDLSVSYEKIGDVQVAQGDLAGALKSYRDGLSIDERLANSDAANVLWQRDLSISYERVGDVEKAQGDLAGALKSYQDNLAIRDRLAKSAPDNALSQRDLAKSDERLGEVYFAQGNLAAALAQYRASLNLMLSARDADPLNTTFQHFTSVTLVEIGDVLSMQGDLAGALKAFGDSLAIRQQLAKSDPTNSDWQDDLSLVNERIGDAEAERGDYAAALSSYLEDLAIIERLTKSDPKNALWQHELSVSTARVGSAQLAQGNPAAALISFQESVAIMRGLAQSDPTNAEWQRELGVALLKVGDVQVAQSDNANALQFYREDLAIFDRLVQSDPGNTGWQHDLAVAFDKIGDAIAKTSPNDAILNYGSALKILEHLAAIDPTNVQWQGDVIELNFDLAKSGDDADHRFEFVVTALLELQTRIALTAEQAGWLVEAKAQLAARNGREAQ